MRLLGAFLRLLVAGALGAQPAPVRAEIWREVAVGQTGVTGAPVRAVGARRGSCSRCWVGKRQWVPHAAPASARLSLPVGPGGARSRQRGAVR